MGKIEGMTVADIQAESGACRNTVRKYIGLYGVKLNGVPGNPGKVPKGKANEIIKAIKKARMDHMGIGK